MDALTKLNQTVTRAYKVNPAIRFEVFIHKVCQKKFQFVTLALNTFVIFLLPKLAEYGPSGLKRFLFF